jgi:hypothetical protein
MASDRAKQFVEYLANTESARTKLLSAPQGDRRRVMAELGYGDVEPREVEALLSAQASDLSDEQLRTIQGGGRKDAIIWD